MASSKSEVARTARALKLVKRYQGEEFSQADNLAAVLVYPKRDYDNELFVKKNLDLPIRHRSRIIAGISGLSFGPRNEPFGAISAKKKYFGAVAENRAYKAQRKFLTQINDTRSIQWLNRQYKKGGGFTNRRAVGQPPFSPPIFYSGNFLKIRIKENDN